MKEQTLNIPSYELFINPRDLQKLRRDIWSDEHVPAKLKVGKVSYQVEVAYRGAMTRELPKKSYHIRFLKPAIFAGGRELHLNAEYLDTSLIRNKLSFAFFQSIGNLNPEAKYVLLQLNGSYMGVYLQLESVDDLFLKKRGLPQGAIFYAHNHDANFSFLDPDTEDFKDSLLAGYKLKLGNENDEETLSELIYKINTLSRTSFVDEIICYVDIDRYLRWLAGVVCTQNYDGFIQNYALYHNSGTALYEMIPWDFDGTWGRDCHGREMACDYFPIEGANTLTGRILDIQEFRKRYRIVLEEILETRFIPEFLEPMIIDWHQALEPHVARDPYKQKNLEKFKEEPAYIIKFIRGRNRYLRSKLIELDKK